MFLKRCMQTLAIVGWAALALWPISNAHAAEEFLRPDQAFTFSAKMADANTIEIRYTIADGYYLYRERFHFKALGAQLGTPVIPGGKIKFDDTFQKNVEIYRHAVVIQVPVQTQDAFTLKATSQGCADQGLCYAPIESEIQLSPAGAAPAATQTPTSASSLARLLDDADMPSIATALASGKLLLILPLFFLLGLGLSFTPCMLPMMPILSSMIVGEDMLARRWRGLALSAAYSGGMALVYTGFGIAAGLIGESLAASLQQPWILSTFALLLVALALSMFGLYHLQIPASLQLQLAKASQRQIAGKIVGVFIMGAISALIVGPCVAPPLAGTLIYLSQTRDVIVAGSALFIMACGMSVPLLLIGISAGSLLPRAGLWMKTVNRFFGVLLLAVALWMITPIIPDWVQSAGWGALALGYGAHLLSSHQSGWLARGIGGVFSIGASVLLLSTVTPLGNVFDYGNSAPTQPLPFTRVKSIAELDAALERASGKIALLDFYADWCVSCKEMEKLTFPDPRVQARLADMLLLQIDVTANNLDDKAMLKRFHLFGPPGIIFFDKTGQEIAQARVIGYQNSEKFLQSLNRLSNR